MLIELLGWSIRLKASLYLLACSVILRDESSRGMGQQQGRDKEEKWGCIGGGDYQGRLGLYTVCQEDSRGYFGRPFARHNHRTIFSIKG